MHSEVAGSTSRDPARGIWLIAGLVCVVSFVFKLATYAVTNDDYLHLASAQQILLGEVPLRDFLDQRELLLAYTSAAVQWLFGRTLLSEVVLDITLLSAGHAMVFVLATRISQSRLLGGAAAAFSVLLAPRLYSYPKVFLYAAALVLIWRYAERRRRIDLSWVAVFTAVAFLFRHDHGAVVGGTMVVMIGLVHWQQGWLVATGRSLLYGVSVAALLLPFLLFVQGTGGISVYVRTSLEMARAEYQRTVGPFPALQVDTSQWVPLPRAIPHRIKVRWAGVLDPAVRIAAEGRLGLSASEELGQNTWAYDLQDTSRRHVLALLADPQVEDTDGINRATGSVPNTRDDPNALAWLLYLTLALPPLTALIVAIDLGTRRRLPLVWTGPGCFDDWLDGVADGLRDPVLWRVLTATVLAGLMQLFLLRARSDVAVADVGVSSAVLAAWLVARGLGVGAGRTFNWPWQAGARPLRWPLLSWAVVRGAVTLWLVIATLVACDRSSGGIQLSRVMRREGDSVTARLGALKRSRAPFGDDAAQYVFACTGSGDRLLVENEYAPDFFYRAGRGFAAGRGTWVASLGPTAEAQAFSLARLQAERVPIALTTDEGAEWFSEAHPGIRRYLGDHYRFAGTVGSFDVLTDSRLTPVRTYQPGNLPCFR